MKVRTQFDKTFNFKAASTWAWDQEAPGKVLLARTADDDPDAVRDRAEPLILEAVSREMPRRGLRAATGPPDLTLDYYLLLTIGTSAQTLGQFLPSTVAWGLPPIAQQTTALDVVERGSLVLDFSAGGQVVWRGIAEAKIDLGLSQEKRAALLREGVREILRRFPPK